MLQQVAPEGALEGFIKSAPSPWPSRAETFHEEASVQESSLEKLSTGAADRLSDAEMYHLEAIVLPANRPAAFVHGDSYDDLPDSWSYLNAPEMKSLLGSKFGSIGRVEVPNSLLLPYAGTGFVVGDGLLMTNRHVAQLFSRGLGLKIFYTAGDAAVGFGREAGPGDDPAALTVVKVELVHPYWDMALLRVEGLGTRASLNLSTRSPEDLIGRDVVVVGYPALDPRNDVALQSQIFGKVFNVKRLQPGVLRQTAKIRSFENTVNALTHDASTLGGNSGSAVLDAKTGEVVALHFAGEYLKANYAVPMYDLAGDARFAGWLNFSGSVSPSAAFDAAWSGIGRGGMESEAKQEKSGSAAAQAPSQLTVVIADQGGRTPSTLHFTVPIHISVSVGELTSGSVPIVNAAAPMATADEGVVVDQDYSNREGYDPEFLDGLRVPLPGLTSAMQKLTVAVTAEHRVHGDAYELAYHHYSLYMNRLYRTAWFSAANVDGRQRPAIGKREGDRWYVDTRIPRDCQLTQKAFEHGIDRGHLTRRDDTAWGADVESATAANNDTFHFTNCALQASMFNRGKDRWQGLEQFLLEKHAKKDKRRMIVMTGPIFSATDPVYRNSLMDYSVRCPMQFWKVCVLVREDGTASATAFLLGQNEITDLAGFTESFDVGVAQITVRDLQKKTGLTFGDLAKHDHFASSGPGTLETVDLQAAPLQGKVILNPDEICI
jgi:DNA/RNA endonuclease G (NUC1)/S1-C subfamily serine protease